jgi:hypothetical protein
MDYIYDIQTHKQTAYILVSVLIILVVNYLFLFSTGNKDDPITRGEVFMIIAIDAILGGVFYWVNDAMTMIQNEDASS